MIRIVSAYPDLLNLYGDYANVAVLSRFLREAGQIVETGSFSVGTYAGVRSNDLLYIGAGTERRMIWALEDFARYFREVRDFAENGGFILATGNAAALLCRSVTDMEGNIRYGAGLIDADVTVTGSRSYRELILSTPLCEQPVIGNINSSLAVTVSAEPMFEIAADSSGSKEKTEGARKQNVFATELSGPLLARNPGLMRKFAELVADKKLPQNEERWMKYAEEGYNRVLAKLKRDLKVKGA